MDVEVKIIDEEELEEMYEYLDDLRESGSTNMFGAAPYLQEEFDLDKPTARLVLSQWMGSFTDRHPEALE